MERQYHLRLFKDGKLKYQVVLTWGGAVGRASLIFSYKDDWVGNGTELKGWEKLTGQKANKEQAWPPMPFHGLP